MRTVWLAMLASLVACSTHVCPTISCQPRVALTYRQALGGPYHLAVAYQGNSFEAGCPLVAALPPVTGISSCDMDGLVVTGVDLGHGSNDTVALTVSIAGGTPIPVTATLKRITNSFDCDLVCFDHEGIVENPVVSP